MFNPNHSHQQATRTGRHIALYPGAFRPPHTAHLKAVQYLHAQRYIDEVVIIISNRCRPIPSTTLALPPDVALDIWRIYTHTLKKVRVEIAPQTAVHHALEYFEQVTPNDHLFFCLGESDYGEGDNRFRTIKDLANQHHIAATVIPAPTGDLSIRSTSMRAALGQGEAGWEAFQSGLPSELPVAQHKRIWHICLNGMQDMTPLTQEKIQAIFPTSHLGTILDIRPANTKSIAPVFRILLENNQHVIVKYAGDSIEEAQTEHLPSLESGERLKVERRSLRWLRSHQFADLELPNVLFYDKKRRILVLTTVCPEGTTLEGQLAQGFVNPAISTTACRFLADCHVSQKSLPPLWGEQTIDQRHWQRTLSLLTDLEASPYIAPHIIHNLRLLKSQSEQASGQRFLHLDFSPKHIRSQGTTVGVVDFEHSTNFGDPAFDIGFFLGHYMYWSLHPCSGPLAPPAFQESLNAYRQGVGDLWLAIHGRVAAFAGATLFSLMRNANLHDGPQTRLLLLSTASALLSHGVIQSTDGHDLLLKAIKGRLA